MLIKPKKRYLINEKNKEKLLIHEVVCPICKKIMLSFNENEVVNMVNNHMKTHKK